MWMQLFVNYPQTLIGISTKMSTEWTRPLVQIPSMVKKVTRRWLCWNVYIPHDVVFFHYNTQRKIASWRNNLSLNDNLFISLKELY